jgi:hypothetical protein
MVQNDMILSATMEEQSVGAFPSEIALAMCYVPVQKLYSVYSMEAALIQGTIFPELDKPWFGSRKDFMYENRGREGRSYRK